MAWLRLASRLQAGAGKAAQGSVWFSLVWLALVGGCFLPQVTAPAFGASSKTAALVEDIFTAAPFASCHASTIVELKNGDLLAAWFGGSGEGKADVAIWAARRTRTLGAEARWSAPYELVREPGVATWNPVLFHSMDGHLWLYYKFGPAVTSWTGARMVSTDEGRTWQNPAIDRTSHSGSGRFLDRAVRSGPESTTDPDPDFEHQGPSEHLPAGLLGPIRAKPYVAPDGTIVSGSSTESYHAWAVWIERSTDPGGMNWQRLGPYTVPDRVIRKRQPVPSLSDRAPGGRGDGSATGSSSPRPGGVSPGVTSGLIQPSVVSLGGSHLRFYARSTEDIGRICVADSYDQGRSWTVPRPLELPNPNSGIDAVALRDGRVVLVYNATTTGRTPLNLAVSRDGEHFTMFRTLESEPGEYSYPAIVQSHDGSLLMTYTWRRERIRFVRVPLSSVP